MFDDDELRNRTEQGKRNMEFKDFMDSLTYEINSATQAGQFEATYSIRNVDPEFVDIAIERLEENLTVTRDGNLLRISWEA